MSITAFITEERGATTMEWVALTAGLLVVGSAVVYAIETGLGDAAQTMTAVVEETVNIPVSTVGPTINVRMSTPEFDGAAPVENEANGIEWAAPHVSDNLGMTQVTPWSAIALSTDEIDQGRARLATLEDEEVLKLVQDYGPHAGASVTSDPLHRILCDKYHIALNESEIRGLNITAIQ